MFLLIDTTEDKSQVALIKGGKILAYKIFQAHFAHSEKLLLEISKLLKQGKAKLDDLKIVIVITGPGFFTGCRVGAASANALAFSLNIPVVGISKNEILNVGAAHFSVCKSIKRILKITQKKLKEKKFTKIVLPYYEKPPHITKAKPIF
jgi:tRNA threonylcarbamoyl adenosine modification protein YeaZ